MKEISVEFTIVTPGSLDPGMHFGVEVKALNNIIPKGTFSVVEKMGL